MPKVLIQLELFLISNFHRVLNVVCILLGNSPVSEFYMTYKIQMLGNYPEESIQQLELHY